MSAIFLKRKSAKHWRFARVSGVIFKDQLPTDDIMQVKDSESEAASFAWQRYSSKEMNAELGKNMRFLSVFFGATTVSKIVQNRKHLEYWKVRKLAEENDCTRGARILVRRGKVVRLSHAKSGGNLNCSRVLGRREVAN